MYSRILNPKTQRMVSIHGKTGKAILKNYITYLLGGFGTVQAGGATEKSDILFFTADWCGHCINAKSEFSTAIKNLRKTGRTVYNFQNQRGGGNMLDPNDVGNPKQMSPNAIEKYFSYMAGRGYPTIAKKKTSTPRAMSTQTGGGDEIKYFSDWQADNNAQRDAITIQRWANLSYENS